MEWFAALPSCMVPRSLRLPVEIVAFSVISDDDVNGQRVLLNSSEVILVSPKVYRDTQTRWLCRIGNQCIIT
jgi:hypothetical protein